MAGYPKLSKAKFQKLVGMVNKLIEEGYTLEKICEITKQPMGRIKQCLDIIKEAKVKKA